MPGFARPSDATVLKWREKLGLWLAMLFVLGTMACAIPVTVWTVEPSDNEARKQIQPLAEKGDVVAQYRLAMAYRHGIGGVKKDAAQSWTWLARSADAHYEPAMIEVADAALFGEFGQVQDTARGLALWRDLARQGSVDAPVRFAMRLDDAKNAWADPAEAASWYRAAAFRGHRFAAYKYAQHIEKPGPAESQIEACAWYGLGRSSVDVERLQAGMTAAQRERVARRRAELERGGV